MFNTGDLGRWRPDGQLEHLGRVDDQVKVKGFRVELDGVVSAMEVSTSSPNRPDDSLKTFFMALLDVQGRKWRGSALDRFRAMGISYSRNYQHRGGSKRGREDSTLLRCSHQIQGDDHIPVDKACDVSTSYETPGLFFSF